MLKRILDIQSKYQQSWREHL